MLTKRIIPCLDVAAGRVVKGVNFVNLRDAGDPVELAAFEMELGRAKLGALKRKLVLRIRGIEIILAP